MFYWRTGDISAYQSLLLEEIKELSASPVASALLATIGSSYLEYAKKESSTMDSFNISFQQASRSVQFSHKVGFTDIDKHLN